MSGKRRSVLERQVQREIEAEIGADPDLLLMKNSVGKARFAGDDGREYHVPYGLGVGSPDLVGILRVQLGGVNVGAWVAFEVKAEGGEPEPEQLKCHAAWRRFGAIVEVVRSAAEARAALERARTLLRRCAA